MKKSKAELLEQIAKVRSGSLLGVIRSVLSDVVETLMPDDPALISEPVSESIETTAAADGVVSDVPIEQDLSPPVADADSSGPPVPAAVDTPIEP